MKPVKATIRNYGIDRLDIVQCPTTPFELMEQWLNKAIEIEPFEANAMVLATVDNNNKPHSRVVLLKEFSEHGLTFYTNYQSDKSHDIDKNPNVAVNFWWQKCERQLRVEGKVYKTDAATSDAYFTSRSRESKLGAYASKQSSTISNRDELEIAFQKYADKYTENVQIPRPENWGGFIIKPEKFEFWQGGAHRLHDRVVYELNSKKNVWDKYCLAP